MVVSPERTLAIIKPAAVAAGYAAGIEALIESNSFAVLARMEVALAPASPSQASRVSLAIVRRGTTCCVGSMVFAQLRGVGDVVFGGTAAPLHLLPPQLTLSSEQIAELYEEYENDPDLFSALTAEMSSGPIIALALEKADGVASWLELLGPEDAAVARVEAPLSVRGVYGVSKVKNAVHGSSSPVAAFRELKLFFPRVFPRETAICAVMSGAVSHMESIESALATDGFLVVAKKVVELTREQAASFYAELEGSPLFEESVSKLTAGPVTALAVEKPFAVEGLNYLLGPADGSAQGTLCSKYGDLYGSESLAAAARETAFFFGDELSTPAETFVWVKPDAFESADAVLAEAEAAGFTIIASEVHTLPKPKAEEFFADLKGAEDYSSMVSSYSTRLVHTLLSEPPTPNPHLEPAAPAATDRVHDIGSCARTHSLSSVRGASVAIPRRPHRSCPREDEVSAEPSRQVWRGQPSQRMPLLRER